MRSLSVFDILERSGVGAQSLALELQVGADRLASYDPTRHLLEAGPQARTEAPWYVAAQWRNEGPGSALSSALKLRMDELEPNWREVDLAAGLPPGLPASDKLLAFSTRHLMILSAFRGVPVLERSYQAELGNVPSPHVMLNEKGASHIELHSIELAKLGLLDKPLDRIGPGDVGFCVDPLLLEYIAAAAASNAITFTVTDRIANEGGWQLNEGGTTWNLGPGPNLSGCLLCYTC